MCEDHVLQAVDMALRQGKVLEYEEIQKEDEASAAIAQTPSQAEAQREEESAKDITESLKELEFATADDVQFAAEMLADIKGQIKRLDERRKEITAPMRQALKSANDLFKPALQHLEAGEKWLKEQLASAHKREEEAKLAALAEANEAVAEGDEEAVSEALQTMAKADGLSEAEGVSYRKVWKYAVERPDAVPRQFCSPDTRKIAAAVQQYKGQTAIPGIRVWEDTQVASRAT